MLLFANLVGAQSVAPEGVTLVESVELPPPIISGEVLELGPTKSESTELESADRVVYYDNTSITEYGVKGRIYKVKVSPAVGLPYYLEDREGRGQIGNKENSIYQNVDTPNWLLLSW